MIIQKTFEQWLKTFDKGLHIEEVITRYIDEDGKEHKEKNKDIENLYYKKEFLGCVPRGSKKSIFWVNVINDVREETSYKTTEGIQHRSLPGVGRKLYERGLISKLQYHKHFLSDAFKSAIRQGMRNMSNMGPAEISKLYKQSKK